MLLSAFIWVIFTIFYFCIQKCNNLTFIFYFIKWNWRSRNLLYTINAFRLLFWYLSEVPILFINSKNCTSNCLFSELRTSLSMLLIVIDSLTVVFLQPPCLYAYCIDKTCIWTRIHNGPVGSSALHVVGFYYIVFSFYY